MDNIKETLEYIALYPLGFGLFLTFTIGFILDVILSSLWSFFKF